MASESTPEREWVLVYDWNEKSISRTRLDGLRENAYHVFPIPRPSYMLDIYDKSQSIGLRIDLSSHADFAELHVINMPPGFSNTGGRPYAPSSPRFPDAPFQTTFSGIPFNDFYHFCTQSTSDLNESFPNILQDISEDIIRVYPSSTGWYDAAITVRWELDQYLETELDFDPESRLDENIFESVLTITGTSSAAYATTASSYIQREWPDDRAGLLRHLRNWARNKGSSSGGLPGGVTTTRMRSAQSKNGLSSARVVVKGKRELIITVAQQLAWLTAVFRKPHYGQTSYSEVVFNQINKDAVGALKEFEITPLGLRKVRRSSKTCWLHLFSNCVIALGFPIPERRNGEKGIELPYQLMTSQAGILFSKTYKGGLFLRGLSTLIYPTASWANHQSVQWHIIYSGNFRTRLPPGTIPLRNSPDEVTKSNWMRCTDLQQLASAPRTFLGYCKDINIYLATQDSDIRQVTYSRAENESHRPALLLDSLAGGTSGMGMVSAQASMRFVRPKGLVKCSRHDTLPSLLDSARLRPVLVYDDHPEAQKGWLVPTLIVVLHMAHIWARDKNLLSKIPYVSPCGEAEEMAMQLIQKDVELRLRRECEEKYECLGDVVKKLLSSLEELIVDEALAKQDPDPTINFESSKVYGWDLVDIARLSLTCRRKQLSIQESWMAVLSDEVLTLFCQGLGEVIRPASASNICSAWNPIPSKRHYLTATVPCLLQLSLQSGGSIEDQYLRLTGDGYWHCPGKGLFDDCDINADSMSTSNRHKCVKVPQQISRRDVYTEIGQCPPIKGAVVFGTRQLPRIAPPNSNRRLLANRVTKYSKSKDLSIRQEHPGESHETSGQNTERSLFRALKSALFRKFPVINEFFS